MRTTLYGGDQVDIALGHRLATLGQPHQRPFRRFMVTFHATDKRFFRQHRRITQFTGQVIVQAVRIAPLQFLAAALVVQGHLQARTQHGLGT